MQMKKVDDFLKGGFLIKFVFLALRVSFFLSLPQWCKKKTERTKTVSLLYSFSWFLLIYSKKILVPANLFILLWQHTANCTGWMSVRDKVECLHINIQWFCLQTPAKKSNVLTFFYSNYVVNVNKTEIIVLKSCKKVLFNAFHLKYLILPIDFPVQQWKAREIFIPK